MNNIEKAIEHLVEAQDCMRREPDKTFLYISHALTALRAAQEREEPLTVEELKAMDCQYVWLVDTSADMPFEGWAIIYKGKIYYYWYNHTDYIGNAAFDLSDAYDISLHGKEWNAFRSRPKEVAA